MGGSTQGHYAVELHSEKVHILQENQTPVAEELPRTLRPRSTQRSSPTTVLAAQRVLCHRCGQGARGRCVACTVDTCATCLKDSLCPACRHGLENGTPTEDALQLQTQEYRMVKKGTAVQNERGLRLAATMHQHELRPTFVMRQMETHVIDVLGTRCRRAVRRKVPKVFHEYACFEDSRGLAPWQHCFALGELAVRTLVSTTPAHQHEVDYGTARQVPVQAKP